MTNTVTRHRVATLDTLAQRHGYRVTYTRWAAKRRNGWPVESARPFRLLHDKGALIAAFADLDALERNLRARAGI